MNKMRSCRIKALIPAVIAIVLLVVVIYGTSSPMSYGCDYYHAAFYEGEDFNGTMVFYPDNTMVIRNTNLDEDYKAYYYYKNGYIFFILVQTEAEYQRLAALFKMFGDGTRVKILHALEQNEMCVCDLAALLGVTKSAVSHQLKALRLANLVKFRRDGQVVYYSLADDHVKYIVDIGFDHIHHE